MRSWYENGESGNLGPRYDNADIKPSSYLAVWAALKVHEKKMYQSELPVLLMWQNILKALQSFEHYCTKWGRYYNSGAEFDF